MSTHILHRKLYNQVEVCSEGTAEEALEWLKTRLEPTTLRWSRAKGKKNRPLNCCHKPNRKHYVFVS